MKEQEGGKNKYKCVENELDFILIFILKLRGGGGYKNK